MIRRWHNAQYWRKLNVSPTEDGPVGAALSAEDTYYVRWGYQVRTTTKDGVCEFKGKALSIGYTDYGTLLQYAGSKYVT